MLFWVFFGAGVPCRQSWHCGTITAFFHLPLSRPHRARQSQDLADTRQHKVLYGLHYTGGSGNQRTRRGEESMAYLAQHWHNVGPASATLGQHYANVGALWFTGLFDLYRTTIAGHRIFYRPSYLLPPWAIVFTGSPYNMTETERLSHRLNLYKNMYKFLWMFT